jgi:outer membrane protein
MRKILTILSIAALLAVSTAQAEAQNIKGKIGLTARLGFLVPADSDYGADKSKLETDAGFVFGFGALYGIDKNWAAELAITSSNFNGQTPTGGIKGDFDVTDISLGGQYRFEISQPGLTPYVGAGFDILLSDFDRPGHSVDNTIGIHAVGGIDYFVTRNVALNAEGKILIAPETDINGGSGGNFDPSGFSGMFGIRYFFD